MKTPDEDTLTSKPDPWIAKLRWLTEAESRQMRQDKAELLGAIAGHLSFRCGRTKPFLGDLSPGCQCCCDGVWSCLFVTPRCTASCPACPQDPRTRIPRPPTAEGVAFDRAVDYADYLKRFGFRGTGLCGGEPFLVYDRLLEFTKTVRERLGGTFYLYVYTNGDLVDVDRLKALGAAGLDEIRFNISARDYDLGGIEGAVRTIPRVSVEVPAIPEDLATLQDRLETLANLGVSHLNVHQLFTTRFNYRFFLKRGYHAVREDSFDGRYQPGVCVAESEITALRLLKHLVDRGLALPCNYCSQRYKDLFHTRGFRSRPASTVCRTFEQVTDSGYIRRLSVPGSAGDLRGLVPSFPEPGGSEPLWTLDPQEGALHVHPSLLERIDFTAHDLIIHYDDCLQSQETELPGNSQRIDLNEDRAIGVLRVPAGHFRIASGSGVARFRKLCLTRRTGTRALAEAFLNGDLRRPDGSRPDQSEVRRILSAEPHLLLYR